MPRDEPVAPGHFRALLDSMGTEIEEYVKVRHGTQFSHGIRRDCAKALAEGAFTAPDEID